MEKGKSVEKEKSEKKVDMKENKNLLYCISNLIGIICKINENISDLLDDLSVESKFSLLDSFQIKNVKLEEEVNSKIRKLERMEDKILDKEQKL